MPRTTPLRARSRKGAATLVGDRAVAGERALVPAGELARVEAAGDELALRDAQLDAPADQERIERVVAAVDANVGVDGDPRSSPVGSGVHRDDRRRAPLIT